MDLALFAIAAILLLLSGAGAPAHALGERSSTVALMRHFLGAGGCSTEGLSPSPVLTRFHAFRAPGHGLPPIETLALSSASGELQTTSLHAIRLRRKQYRTRFGFADGAYLATAPPHA